jgi:hypothetical protein
MIFATLVLLLVSLTNGASTYQAGSSAAPVVRDLSPAPGATLRSFFPTVAAVIASPERTALNRPSVHLFFDGKDVTPATSVNGNSLSYTPRQHVSAGWHDVFLEGKDVANRTFSEAWIFRTDDPDIDLPAGDEASFGFLPIGIVPGTNGPFMHFFFVSPFSGIALLQLCGFAAPLTQVPGTPVFFVTTPLTLGTVLLGCTPAIAFTPFGLGNVTPIFFPIEIAGPGIFQTPTQPRGMAPVPGAPRVVPPGLGVPRIGVPPIGVPRVGVPRVGVPPIGVPPVGVPRAGVPRSGVPRVGVPRISLPGIPHPGRP